MNSAIERERAFVAAMEQNKLLVKDSFIKCGSYSKEGGRLAALDLLKQNNRPTAVFACNDDMAFGLYAAAKELGINIPEDLSVIGFDDVFDAARSEPALTTFQQPYGEFARFAAKAFSSNDFKTSAKAMAKFILRSSVKHLS